MAAKKGIAVSREQLQQWYYDEGKSTLVIANLLGIEPSTVLYWMNKFDIPRRSKAEALTKTLRMDFDGSLTEKAYLIGFRLGDLHIYKLRPKSGETIRVMCASTKMSQIELIRTLFEPYGHLKVTPQANGVTAISCYLNMSFAFLLPKQDAVESWILADDECSIAFLAGYLDAEGSFGIDANGSANLKVESYDVTILHQLHGVLVRFDVFCPPPRLIKKKGTTKQKLNQDLWRLGVYRKVSFDRLCMLLEPFLQHEKRRQDMMLAWKNVRERGLS
jgi:intein-encoded DNA endonuclease-like protein